MTQNDTESALHELYAAYVGGSLSYPAQVLVNAHLELNPQRRALVDAMQAEAGSLLEEMPSMALSGSAAARIEAIVSAPVSAPGARQPQPADPVFPPALRAFAGFSASATPWKTKLPGFKEHAFGEIEGCDTSLLWVRPGRAMPHHTHEGSELTLLLSGSYTDVTGRYARGDLAVADGSIDHRPIAGTEEPCICFTVVQGKLQLSGSLLRRLGDILGT